MSKTARVAAYILIYILLPLALFSGVIFRFSFTSFIYALLLLILPWLGSLAKENQRRIYLLIGIACLISILTLLAQGVFQIVLAANTPYGHIFDNHTNITQIFRCFGLERLDHSSPTHILRLFLVDIFILAITIIYFIINLCCQEDKNESNTSITQPLSKSITLPSKLISIFKKIPSFIQWVLFGFSAIVYPSILNSIYMIIFLVLIIIWAFSIKNNRKYILFYGLVIYVGIHLLIYYLYQFEIIQNTSQPLLLWNNITGLMILVTTNPTDGELYFTKDLVWTDYANPCSLIILYFYLAFEIRRFQQERSNTQTASQREQPINSGSNTDQQNTIHSSGNRRVSLELSGEQTRSGHMTSAILDITKLLQQHNYLYLISLFCMLAWSIIFHSLLTLPYLILACVLWILPHSSSSKWCLKLSPVFTIYGGILLLVHYSFAFKWNSVDKHQAMKYLGIRINDFQSQFFQLLAQAVFLIFFVLTFRQHIKKNGLVRSEGDPAQNLTIHSDLERLTEILKKFFTKYWIFLSCGMLLLVCLHNKVVIYRTIYMIFYLLFILSFQISSEFWRKQVKTFLGLIIAYSMLVLLVLYISQITFINEFLWERFGDNSTIAIELDIIPSESLALNLLIPSLFLVVNILQFQYFHSGWIELTKMPRNTEQLPNRTIENIHDYARIPNSPDSERISNTQPTTWLEHLEKIYGRINRFCKHTIIYYSWRFIEIHIYKLTLLLMVLISVYKVCAFNIILIILVTIGLVFHQVKRIINLLTLFATSIYILASMCYELPMVQTKINEENTVIQNCSHLNSTVFPLLLNDTIKWFGLESTTNFDRYLGLHILLTIVLTFDAITQYRQKYRRRFLSNHFNVHLIENRFPVLFEPFAIKDDNNEIFDITNNPKVDQGVWDFFKYMINFVFYRFGLEVCYLTTAFVIAIRLDIIALFYAIWLILFISRRRRFVQRLWVFYRICLIILFPIQYISLVGIPPWLCFEYPWTNIDIAGWPQLGQWLFLPDYINPPSAKLLIADFFQVLFVCQQWRVFQYEKKEKHRIYSDMGGSNDEIKDDNRINPTWNFVLNRRHWLDHIKYFIFMYGTWIILSIVYFNGITRISLLRLGYLFPCFLLFWRGQSIFKKTSKVPRLWSFLIYYCIVVIILKTCIQVVVCIYLPLYMSRQGMYCQRTSLFCIIVNLLVPCLKTDFMVPINCSTGPKNINDPCTHNVTNAGLFMDGFCLILLLLQKRIFNSYYWKYIVDELNSQTELAKQGAKILENILEKKMGEDKKRQDEKDTKLKKSVERIEEKQKQLQESIGNNSGRTANDHYRTIRSGSISMFPEQSEEEDDDSDDEGKQDEMTIAQGRILEIYGASNVETVVATMQKMQDHTSDSLPTSEQSDILPPTTTTVSHTASVTPKDQSKNTRKLWLIKTYLIGLVIVDYFTELFNRNCGNYGIVSKRLSEKKSSSTFSKSSRFSRLFDSLFYFIMSHSEFICYAGMVISHVTSGSILSLPLPLSIFFWAMLSSRPSRYYWIIVLTYSGAMIIIKYIFQFEFYEWNAPRLPEPEPLSIINIFGINRQGTGAFIADLFLFLSLFAHRSILKQLGLWKNEPISSDTAADAESAINQNETSTTEPLSSVTSIENSDEKFSVHDVYTPMVFCDFINLIISIVFYSQFSESVGSVLETLKENRVPKAFLILLALQFLFIVIDRVLYLRRYARVKLIFQLFQVLGVHIWLFFILPSITHTNFRDNVAAQFWYLFKCIYFGYSSIQIRLGYPKRIVGNFLMKRSNWVNKVSYQIYLLVPLLHELRTIMDWICTNTALGLASWIQLADIYSQIYLLKCARWKEEKSPIKPGEFRPMKGKIFEGGIFFIVIMLLIWFPLLFFTFSSSFYQANPPKEVYMDIKLDDYLPIYQMTTQRPHIRPFTSDDLDLLRGKIVESTIIKQTMKDSAKIFLSNFDPDDILCVNFYPTSVNLWEISDPIRDTVISNLLSNETLSVRFSYTITRNPLNQADSVDTAGVVTEEHIVSITKNEISVRKNLIEILNGTVDVQTTRNFTIDKLMPRFIHVRPKSRPEEIDFFQLIFPYDYYANITMGLNRTKTIPNSTYVWWQMIESYNIYNFNASCSNYDKNYLTMIFFNDKVSPPNVSFLAQYGIFGLYTTFVIVVARLLRTMFEKSRTIMFDELPSVKRLWSLLCDIDSVRGRNASLEEQLFAKLLFLYRSPEALIKFTKPKSQ